MDKSKNEQANRTEKKIEPLKAEPDREGNTTEKNKKKTTEYIS